MKEKNISDLSMNDYRFHFYKLLADKSSFKLEKLPPTVAATTQHSYRVYFQLQVWLGKNLDPTKWGWTSKTVHNMKILVPYCTDKSAIPEDLLKKISCNCKTGCGGNKCGCRKHGLQCTELCTNCFNNCTNIETHSDDFNESDEISAETEIPTLFTEDNSEDFSLLADLLEEEEDPNNTENSQDDYDRSDNEMDISLDSESHDGSPLSKRLKL